MATFKKSKTGAVYIVEATGHLEMTVLTRTGKERFTDFVDREAKRQGLRAVVNGSFTDLSLWNSVSVALFSDPLDPNEAKPVGLVVKDGKQIAGSPSTGKFYFAQNVCGTDRFSSGQGDPPLPSCAAVGGLAPIVVDGIPYGVINTYAVGVPAGAPLKGDVDPKYKKFLLQKSNAMFTELLGRGTSVGKVAVGYSNSKQTLLLIVQDDSSKAAGVDAERVRTMFTMNGVENAVFMDSSNSSTLWYEGKFEVRPSSHKDEYLDVAIGFK